jgi:hypothetical protein
MIGNAAPPPPRAYPDIDDIEHSVFGFYSEEWEDIPYPAGLDWFDADARERRNGHADKYQQCGGDPTLWYCYLHLGFFAFEDCSDFEKAWLLFDEDPLTIHKIIWYQFLYHMDRRLPIPAKLQKWATDVTHPFLSYHEPEALTVDTGYAYQEWRLYPEEAEDESAMDVDTTADEGKWNEVDKKGRTRSKSPVKMTENQETTYNIPGWTKDQNKRAAGSNQLSTDQTQSTKLVKPASRPPQVATVTEGDETETQLSEEKDKSLQDSVDATNATRSKALPRLTSFPNISVNDGTHRVTIRWKPTGGVKQYESDKPKLYIAIRAMLSNILTAEEGRMYKWEKDDLSATAVISALTPIELPQYVTPNISVITATSQIVFGIRVGFAENPVKWQNTESTRTKLKTNKVELKVYNSSSAGGKPVIAGYILLKAPNTTSTHRYTQYLRHQMPDVTPYFDVERYKKTPMDQLIPHLVVLCGERYVTSVSQSLTKILTGKGTAVFLPRYTLSAMSESQISNQFLVHEKWLRSLKPISMAPMVFHLDQQRIEYYENGDTIQRSTREWVGTLTRSDGSAALCDAVNGTKDKTAMLLAPAHYLDQATQELRAYKMRISPPSHREARFRESIPDLPDEIHIQTAADSNISFMTNLLSSEDWQKLPAVENEPGKPSGTGKTRGKKKPRRKKTTLSTQQNAWDQPPAITDLQTSELANEGNHDSEDDATSLEERNSLATDDQSLSIAATQSLTQYSETHLQAKLRDLETATRKKLETLQIAGRTASKQLESLEDKFNAFSATTTTQMEKVQEDLTQVAKQLDDSVTTQLEISGSLGAMQRHNNTQFEQLGEHLVANSENVDSLTTSVTEIRTELDRIFGLIASDIAGRNALTTTLHQQQGRMPGATFVSTPSSESPLRSPPPKRTRDGDALTENPSCESEGIMLIDQCDSSALLDTTFDEVEDENHETGNGFFDDESTGSNTCTDLDARFENAGTEDDTVQNHTQGVDDEAISPSWTQDNPPATTITPPGNPLTTTKHAPLNSQYTEEMGSAGAADK